MSSIYKLKKNKYSVINCLTKSEHTFRYAYFNIHNQMSNVFAKKEKSG